VFEGAAGGVVRGRDCLVGGEWDCVGFWGGAEDCAAVADLKGGEVQWRYGGPRWPAVPQVVGLVAGSGRLSEFGFAMFPEDPSGGRFGLWDRSKK
jgi:hypothetical protein